MDLASLLGLGIGFVLLIASIVTTHGASLGTFLDLPAMLLVVGGTFCAVMICFPWFRQHNGFAALQGTAFSPKNDIHSTIASIVHLAEIARRSGILTLEDKIKHIPEPFLARTVQMVVDGTRKDIIEETMRTAMHVSADRRKTLHQALEQGGRFAPAFGLIGTLLGLIVMLINLDDPEKIAPGMSSALTATLYGVLLANAVCLPFSEKFRRRAHDEQILMELMLRGALAIQAGEHPRLIEQRLEAFLPDMKRLPSRKMPTAAAVVPDETATKKDDVHAKKIEFLHPPVPRIKKAA